MKKKVLIAVLFLLPACVYVDRRSTGPENRCPYEGAECPNAQFYMREYQVELDQDSIYIFDGSREVGSAPWSGCAIDSVFLKDNE